MYYIDLINDRRIEIDADQMHVTAASDIIASHVTLESAGMTVFFAPFASIISIQRELSLADALAEIKR